METTKDINERCLEDLIQCFYNGNLNFNYNTVDVEKMDWNWQQAFLSATVKNKLFEKYPVSSQFAKLFLKKLIDFLEPYQEIHDDLYAQLCSAMKASNQENYCFKHYILGKDIEKVITMKETKNMVFNGTTGLKTWQAALILSDWALCNKDIFINKNVLELGSGVGFAGITIGKMCDVKSSLLTDCHNDVLQTIHENIQINYPDFTKKSTDNITLFVNADKAIGSLLLDWNHINNLTADIAPDIIIGADIVYDPLILQPLCNVIKGFCEKNKHLEVYIASVIRNEDTYNRFLKTLDAMAFSFEEIEMKGCVFIQWDESVHKSLLKIKLS